MISFFWCCSYTKYLSTLNREIYQCICTGSSCSQFYTIISRRTTDLSSNKLMEELPESITVYSSHNIYTVIWSIIPLYMGYIFQFLLQLFSHMLSLFFFWWISAASLLSNLLKFISVIWPIIFLPALKNKIHLFLSSIVQMNLNSNTCCLNRS